MKPKFRTDYRSLSVAWFAEAEAGLQKETGNKTTEKSKVKNIKKKPLVGWVGGLVLGLAHVGSTSPVHAQQVSPYASPSSWNLEAGSGPCP